MDELEDSPNQILDNYYMMELIGTDTIDEKRRKIMKVTKEDIINLHKKINMDTIFVLEGENNEEN